MLYETDKSTANVTRIATVIICNHGCCILPIIPKNVGLPNLNIIWPIIVKGNNVSKHTLPLILNLNLW